MEERQRRPRPERTGQTRPVGGPHEELFGTGSPGATDPAPDVAGAGDSVHVIHGPLTMDLALAGMTVAQARELLRSSLHLSDELDIVVDGDDATSDTRLARGNTLEFVRRAGEKGAVRP